MFELIKEDFTGIIKKKRFIIMSALVFLGMLGYAIYTKINFWNDLTYYISTQDYLFDIAGIGFGLTLIISVYHLKFTRFSILQVQDKGLKRSAGVFSKAIAGSLILVCLYALMGVFMLFLGLILGAKLTGGEVGALLLRLFMDCLAVITAYVGSLFLLYLFAFPAASVLYIAGIVVVLPNVFSSKYMRISQEFRILSFFFSKLTTDEAFTKILLGISPFPKLFVLLAQAGILLLPALLIFKLKKLKPLKEKKKKKKGAVEETESTFTGTES